MSESTVVNAWAAMEPGARFEPFQFEFGPLGDDEVEIEVTHCGICHSDHNMRNDDWGMTVFPFVGGHEVEGRVARIGASVTGLAIDKGRITAVRTEACRSLSPLAPPELIRPTRPM